MLIDLSHTVRAGLVTYPGLPAPTITPHLTREDSRRVYAEGTQFAMDIITMIGNTGTYIDSPFHRYGDGGDLASLDLATLVDLPTVTVHLRGIGRRGIEASDLPSDIASGSAVLLDTGWDRHFGTPAYASDAPFLTAAGTRALIAQGVALVGIDSLNIDDTSPDAAGARPAHSLLLGSRIHVVEHLTGLDAVPERGARFTAVPPKVEGFGTFPVRAFASVPDTSVPGMGGPGEGEAGTGGPGEGEAGAGGPGAGGPGEGEAGTSGPGEGRLGEGEARTGGPGVGGPGEGRHGEGEARA